MSDHAPTSATHAVFFQPGPADLPQPIRQWLDGVGVPLLTVSDPALVKTAALRSRPRFILVDGRSGLDSALTACRLIKGDAYTGVVPVIALVSGDASAVVQALEASADDVIIDTLAEAEILARLVAALRRSDRDVGVHPSTRLPGARAILAEIERRLIEPFAVCYADLDHFKEFNDRYSFTEGDRVIRILATLLHDTVKGVCGDEGFVGHIGGDDFIFVIPRDRLDEVCGEIVNTFDALVAYQYSEHDRRAGYFFGKDRRGQLHRVPLMTLSIGVVTNDRRTFANAKMVSDLATEMKTYAKTLPGSVFAVDRRTDDRAQAPLTPQFMGVTFAQ
jgi:diguanylate cyclase (GGDEF)-like protein